MKKQIIHSLSKPNNIETDEYHVYVNTDITENEIKRDDETVKEYTYTQEMYKTQEYLVALNSQIAQQNQLISDLAQKQGFNLVETSTGVFEFIKSDEPTPDGDYLNPILYEDGISVETGKFYTDGDNIWEAIKDGIPSGFDDKEYFDIIET